MQIARIFKDRQMDKKVVDYISMEYCAAMKKYEVLQFGATCRELENIIIIKIYQWYNSCQITYL